jgi:hypothetical protein
MVIKNFGGGIHLRLNEEELTMEIIEQIEAYLETQKEKLKERYYYKRDGEVLRESCFYREAFIGSNWCTYKCPHFIKGSDTGHWIICKYYSYKPSKK